MLEETRYIYKSTYQEENKHKKIVNYLTKGKLLAKAVNKDESDKLIEMAN